MSPFTRSILLRAALPTLLVGLLVVGVAAAVGGGGAALGALLGVAVVVPFFAVGQILLSAVLEHNPTMGMTVAMMLYLAKIGVLALLLVLLADATAFDTKVFAVNVLVCTLVWTGAEVWILASSKVLYVDPEGVPDALRTRSDTGSPG